MSGPNGLGPWWFPSGWRSWLTGLASLFFQEANWIYHDQGYERGSPDRATCDRKFLSAMLRDASQKDAVTKIALCAAFAWIFWILVRSFGWASYCRKSPSKG